MSDQRDVKDCVIKLIDEHGVEHTAKVRAESVYEAALKGLKRLESVGWRVTVRKSTRFWWKYGRSQPAIG